MTTLSHRIARIAQQVASATSPLPLSEADLATFHEDGFFVVRGSLTPEQVDDLRAPIMRTYEASSADPRLIEASPAHDLPPGWDKPGPYPTPGNHTTGSRILGSSPEVIPLSADHPVIVAAVEQVLGERAVLSQFATFNRTPGSMGTGRASKAAMGMGTHYDYKPWRSVGSFLGFIFAIVPLVDYEEENGPLLVARGSHSLTQVLQSDGRIHPVRCASVPSPEEAAQRLVNPHLRAGDLLLMDGFCWHEAWPNRSSKDRIGLYMKYHGLSRPPAVGPIIHPTAARRSCRLETQNTIFRHHRSDHCAGIRFRNDDPADGRTEPIPTIDSTAIVFEREDGLILAVPAAQGSPHTWRLPYCDIDEAGQYSPHELSMLHYLDCGNGIRGMANYMKAEHGLRVPWMSWITDTLMQEGEGQHLRRVYAFRPAGHFENLKASCGDLSHGTWVAAEELNTEEAKWVRMWQQQIDDSGCPVKRGIGFEQTVMNHALSSYQTSGNDLAAEAEWLCAEFNDAGNLIMPKGKLASAQAAHYKQYTVSAAQVAS